MGQSRRQLTRTFIVPLALSAFLTTACAEDRSSTTTTESTPTPAQAHLTRFLIRDNEEPGWKRIGELETFSSVDAFVKAMDAPAADEERLRDQGFEAGVLQRLEEQTGFGGVTEVMLFATAEGADREVQHRAGTELRARSKRDLAGATIKRFTVPGVRSARGFTAKKREEHITVVNWSQGRCVLGLGNGGEEPLVEAVRTGVKAVYERTNGDCP